MTKQTNEFFYPGLIWVYIHPYAVTLMLCCLSEGRGREIGRK